MTNPVEPIQDDTIPSWGEHNLHQRIKSKSAPQGNTEQLDEIIYCDTGCALNADPADGFTYCTCGAQELLKKVVAWNKATVEQALIDYQSELLKDYEADVAQRVKATVIEEYKLFLKSDPNKDEWFDTNEWRIWVDSRIKALNKQGERP